MVSLDGSAEPSTGGPAPTSRSRRLSIILALAVAILLLADLAVTGVSSHLDEPLYWPTFEVQHKYDALPTSSSQPSIVLFGDSVLDSAADPATLTGKGADAPPNAAFNASLAGEPLSVIAEWATQIVVPRLHPSTVVIGFDINVLNDGEASGESALDNQFHSSRPVAVAEGRADVLDHLDHWLHDHVGLYKYRSVIRQPFGATTAGTGPVYDPPLSPAGWNSDFAAGKLGNTPDETTAAAAALDGDLLLNFQPSTARADQLRDFVSSLRSEGTKVVFVSMPVSRAFVKAVPSGRVGWRAAVREMRTSAQAGGATVLTTGIWPTQDFADAAHFNQAGTDRFGAWLTARLTQ